MAITSAGHKGAFQQQHLLAGIPAPQPVPVPTPTGPVYAVDGSNYTAYDYTDAVLSAWRNAGVGLVIEQALLPPAGYPPTRTQQHVGACVSFGMPVASYVFWWASAGTAYLQRQLSTLNGYEDRLVRLWLDIEDTTVGLRPGTPHDIKLPVEHLRRLMRQYRPRRDPDLLRKLSLSLSGLQSDVAAWQEVLDTLPAKNTLSGQYSGPWYSAYVDLSPFANRPWWSAEYNGTPDVNAGHTWGGHSLPMTIHQYAGSTSLAGFGGIDLNFVSAAEVALF